MFQGILDRKIKHRLDKGNDDSALTTAEFIKIKKRAFARIWAFLVFNTKMQKVGQNSEVENLARYSDPQIDNQVLRTSTEPCPEPQLPLCELAPTIIHYFPFLYIL